MKKLNGNILKISMICIYIFLIYSCIDAKKEDFKVYDFLNNCYLPLLDSDSFPRNIYYRPIDVSYNEGDTIIVDDLKFVNIINRPHRYFDYSFKWNFDNLQGCSKIDSIAYVKCPKGTDHFRSAFGKGFIFISKPLLSGKFLFIAEYKIRTNIEDDKHEDSYLIYEKIDSIWILKNKIKRRFRRN